MSKFYWLFFALLAISIGFYPIIYLFIDTNSGLLGTKSEALLETFWMDAFYLHIVAGGIALLTGWPQFNARLRAKYISAHRLLGRVYLIAVTISGIAGLYIAFQATGGIVAQVGFSCLAIAWLLTSLMSWKSIRQGEVPEHQRWMIRSYALCFAAVTLRIWLPAFTLAGIPFLISYVIISWLCWVPNLLVAELMIRNP